MYSYIEGTISELNPAYVVIDCQGIGYEINISLNTFSHIKGQSKCRLFTHLAIKNEATTPVGFVLYGFADPSERSLFRMLISVSGIGSSTAILMLSSLSPDKLYNAIRDNNAVLLQSVKGIGAKSAQRIIIDLKDKLDKGKMSPDFISASYNTNKDEALSGLTVLGFNKASAEKALDKIIQKLGPDVAIEDLIKEALKIL
ncbi:MAG TPA: Holliday junction branch migration protein RuvA [Bacteroidales bacterium]|nr:Holliday junction branch migration protein RuvA [Bacteroidales bacterium]HPE58367.1 Holliday junction branch migration protein RuvA [Bacteroidales bacterium]HRX97760.1 Holliday junction branch migration protein RuvA [Bacteroidales bacterium]